MKYKAINIITGEKTLCDKVTIDGFDYYVSDEKPLDKEPYYVDNSLGKRVETAETKPSGIVKRVITCNNPNIDIPKVVNEVEVLAEYQFPYIPTRSDCATEECRTIFKMGYNKSRESHSFSEEDMIEFATYFYTRRIQNIEETINSSFQLWKEQQPKQVYYQHENLE